MSGPAFCIVLIRLCALDVLNCVLPSVFKKNLNVGVVVVFSMFPKTHCYDEPLEYFGAGVFTF